MVFMMMTQKKIKMLLNLSPLVLMMFFKKGSSDGQHYLSLSQENELPIVVFDMNTPGNLEQVVAGKNIRTKVN